jgi:hypothetical protein
VRNGGGIWSSNTGGQIGASLTLEDSGNLVVSTETDDGESKITVSVWQTYTKVPCIGKNNLQS